MFTKFSSSLLVILLSWSSSIWAKQHAILIGVSEYPNLESHLQLEGPANDVLLMSSVLQTRGFNEQNITLLSEAPNAIAPTKQAISEAITSLAAKVSKGDFVYLHFSGHGSQQPAAAGDSDEPDGLDEIFLPRDVGPWDFGIGSVENAITDNEIRRWLAKLTSKGADVWVVFDSCNSGTMTRSASRTDVRMRKISPAALGVPATASASAAEVLLEPPSSTKGEGKLVAFFAAQSHQETPEMKLPSHQGKPHGLFSYQIASALAEHPQLSYQQLAQLVNASYSTLPWRRTQPLFVGVEQGGQIFSDQPSYNQVVGLVSKTQLQIQAGSLAGFNPGAWVDIYPSPTAESPEASLQIASAELQRSYVTLEKPLAEQSYYVRLARAAPAKNWRVRWLTGPSVEVLNSAAAAEPFLAANISWVEQAESADISLLQRQDKLLFFTAEDDLDCYLKASCQVQGQLRYLSLPPETSETALLSTGLNGVKQMVRAHNLLSLTRSLGQRGGKLSLELKAGDEQQLEKKSLSQALVLADGQTLSLSFKNRAREPMDVTVLFIDSAYGIYQVFPEPGQSGRLFPGEKQSFSGNVEASTLGHEQLLVLASPVTNNDPASWYGFLEQPPMEFTEQLLAISSRSSVDSLLQQLVGDVPNSRGFSKKQRRQAKASAALISFEVRD